MLSAEVIENRGKQTGEAKGKPVLPFSCVYDEPGKVNFTIIHLIVWGLLSQLPCVCRNPDTLGHLRFICRKPISEV